MPYEKDYFGHDVPKLGFGLMRLPELEDGSHDIPQICDMVDLFLESGLNYFDTAYVYDAGQSEVSIGKALVERYPRDAYTMASKMNAWLGSPTKEQVEDQFRISCERMGVDYLDYYLVHAVQENNWELYDEYGIWDYVKGLKEQGLVRHWGFSFHALPERLEKLLDQHPDVDFIQLQVNYADWNDAKNASGACARIAEERGVPFTIMEPVKGGMLANPPTQVAEVFDRANERLGLDLSYAAWAIRFAASVPGVITVLSGMRTLEQMQDNVSYMKNFKPMSEAELAVIDEAREIFTSTDQIKCTACHYCTDGCPMGIPIPDFFAAMNHKLIWNNDADFTKYYTRAQESSGTQPADCIACGQCEGACPQGLPIISLLDRIASEVA